MENNSTHRKLPLNISFFIKSLALGLLFNVFSFSTQAQKQLTIVKDTFKITDPWFDDNIQLDNNSDEAGGNGVFNKVNKAYDYDPKLAGVGYDTIYYIANTGGFSGDTTDIDSIVVNPVIRYDTTYTSCANGSDFSITHAIDTPVTQPGSETITYFGPGVYSNRFYPDSIAVPGTYTIYVTDTVTQNGVHFTDIDSTTVTLTPPPAAYQIMPSDSSYCQGVGNQGVRLWLSGNDNGVSYVLEKNGNPVDTVVGDGVDTLTFNGLYQFGNYTAYAYSGSCTNTMNDTAVVSVITPGYPNMLYFSDSSYCQGGAGVELGLDDTELGVDYYLIHNNIDTAATISGTGTSESLGFHTDSAGYYTLDMTNGACVLTNEDSLKIYIDSRPASYFLSGPDGFCEGSSATLELSNSEDSVSYTLIRDSDNKSYGTKAGTGNTLTWSVADTGTFYVTAQNDTTLCEGMMNGQVTLEEFSFPTVTTSPDTAICPGTSAQISASGGSVYRWNTASTLSDSTISDPIATPLANTTYSVTVTDTNGCVNTGDVLVEVVTPPTVNAGPADTAFCYGDTITLKGSASANTLPIGGYYWEDIDSAKTVNVSGAPKGYHVFQAWDTKGCMNTDTIDVTIKTNPSANAADADMCKGDSVTLSVNATGVLGIDTYEWSTGSTTTTTRVGPSASNAYTVTVTDLNGCADTDTSFVTVHNNPSVSVQDTSVCPGGTATLTAVASGGDGGPYNYTWSTAETTQSIDVSVSSQTKYYVTATDSYCSAVDSGIVSIKNIPTINISGLDSAYCNNVTGFTFNATPDSGSYTSPWSNTSIFEDRGNGEAYFNPSNVSIEDTFNITYQAIGNNTCVNDTTMRVAVHFIPAVAFSGLPDTLCENADPITLNGNPGDSNGAFSGSGITDNGDGTGVFDPSSAGTGDHTIIYTYTDPITGCSNSASNDVYVKESPERYSLSATSYYCETSPGDSISLSGGDAGIIYEVVRNGSTVVYDTTLAASGGFTFNHAFTQGVYEVIAYASNGCVDTMLNSISTTLRELPDDAQPVTGDDTVMINGIGYYEVPPIANTANYNWIKPAAAVIDSGNGTRNVKIDFAGVSAGDKSIGVYGSNSCGNGDTAYINVYVLPEPLAIDSIAGPASVCEGSQSVVFESYPELTEADSIHWIVPSGFTIISGRGTQTIEVNIDSTTASSGYVSARGMNASGAGVADSLYVTVNPIPTIDNVSITDILDCAVDSVLVIGNSNTPSANYKWVGGGNTIYNDSLYANQAGDYTLTVNAKGCTHDTTITVKENKTAPSVSIATPDTITCSNPEVTLEATTNAGSAQYVWSSGPQSNIQSGDSTATPTVNSNGVYTVTVTNTVNSCTNTASITVEADSTAPGVVLSDPLDITCSRDTSIISANNIADASYQWSGPSIIDGQGTNSIVVDQIGTYSLKVTLDNTGCSQTKSKTVQADSSQPTNVVLTKSGDITCDAPQIGLEATTSTSNVSYYFYPLSSGNIVNQSGNTATVDQPDQYAVAVTKNSTGCTTEDTVNVDDLRNPVNVVVDVSSTEITCNEPYDTLTITSNLNNRIVQWSVSGGGNIVSGIDSSTAIVDAAGDYTAVVTDTITGCSGTDVVNITNNTTPPNISNISRTPDSLTCASDVNLKASVSGYSSLSWSGPGNISPTNSDSVYVDAPGTYTLTAAAVNGCTSTANKVVPADTSSPNMVLTSNYPDITCTNLTDTLEVSSSTSNVTYQWNKVSGSGTITDVFSQNPVVDGEGTYRIVITGDNGCTTEGQVTVDTNYTKPIIVNFDTEPDSISCANDWVELSGESSTPGATLYWTTAGIGTILDPATSTPEVNETGTYTLTVTHPLTGCTRQKSVEVNPNFATPTADVDQNVGQITCAVDTVRLDGSASTGVNFKWTARNGSSFLPNDSVEQPYVTSDGWYILTVEHPTSGCTDKDSVEVLAAQNVPYILMGYIDTDTLSCKKPQLVIPVDSVDVPDYWWTTSGGNIVSGDSSLNVTVDQPGIYTFHAIDSTTGCTNSKSVTIYEDKTKPNVSFSSDTLTCAVDTVNIESTIEYANDPLKVTYQWAAGAGGDIVAGDENRPNPRVTASATYNLTLTDDVNGCQRITSHFVARNNAKPSINLNKNPKDITCARSKVTLEDNTGQTDVSYKWTTTGSGNIGNPSTPTPDVDAAGWYTLKITSNNTGCFVKDSVYVDTNYTTPSVFIDPVNDITCSNPEVQLSGGSPDSVSFKWTGPNITGDPTSSLTYADEGGVYTLTVTDKINGCKNDSSVMVVEDNNPPSAPQVNDTSTCFGSSNVELTATGTNIKWYDDASLTNQVGTGNTYTPTVTATGNYVFYATQTGANGCTSAAASVIYSIHSLPSKPTAGDKSVCYGQPNPFLEATPSNSNYSINWYNISDSLLSTSDSYKPQDSLVGTYEYAATQVDLNGCESAQENVYFTINDLPAAPVVEDDTLSVCYGSTNKSFIAYGTDVKWYDTEPPANAISTGNVFTPSQTATGTYTYYVTQSNSTTSCESDYAEVTYIILPNPAQYDLLGGGTYCEGTGGLEISLSNSDAADTYELRQDGNPFITNVSGTGGALSFGNLTAEGTYTAYATASNGCMTKMNGTSIIDMNPLPEDAGTIVGDSVVCEGSTAVEYTVPEIDHATDYVWSIPTGATIAAGNNSNTIAVNYPAGSQSGSITVYGTNACGDGAISTAHAITVNQMPDDAGAISGPNEICQGTDDVTFEVAQIANANTYVWNLPSGAEIVAGSGTRTIIVDFNESSTGGVITVYGQNDCGAGAESPDHTLDVNPKPIINIDDYQSICSSTDSLIVNNPGGGATVNWQRIQGQGNIADNTSFETEVTNLGRGINKFEVIVSDGTCPAVDTLTIENNQLFVNAGPDETLCADSTILSGSQPDPGVTAAWSVEQGSASFADAGQYNTSVSGLSKGTNVLRWTLTKNGCQSYDEVIITNNSPTKAEAGISTSICTDSTFLDANATLSDEYGEWSIINGGGNFADKNNPDTKVTNIAKGDNTYQWTITKNYCSSSDQVTLTNNTVEVEAGDDQIICTYKTTMNATPPPSGTSAYWRVARGSADIIDQDSPTTDVYLLLKDTTVLHWVVDKNGCLSYDSIMIVNNSPTKADAGDDQVIYQTSTFLNATTPTKGTGEWSLLSGSGEFADNTDPDTEVTDLAYGKNVFQWLVTYKNCTSVDTVIIDNQSSGGVDAGSDTTICQDYLMLNASEPVQGEGEWSVVTGSATFDDKNDNNTVARNLAQGENKLKWTVVGNGIVSDVVTITNNSPTEANAGPDMTYCADSAQLTANSPAVGTGVWSIIGGSGTFEDSTMNNTMVHDLGSGNNTLRWTIENKGCRSSDDVIIKNNKPTVADAGEDQLLCSDEAVLYGNSPAIGEGLWTLVSGSNSVVFQDQNVGNTVVENLGHGENILRWTITNGNCSSSDDVVITNDNPTTANAGQDKSICVDSFQLNANEATIGTGEWTVITGFGEFDNVNENNTKVRELSKGGNILRWTITHNSCVSYDEVEISNDLVDANAGFDQSICVDSTSLSANNPTPGDGYWSVIAGSAVFEDPTNPNTDVNGLDYQVPNILKWTISNNSCVSTDTVTIANNHPGIIYAGQDKGICGDDIILKANPNYLGTGKWESLIGGGIISSPNSPETSVSDLGLGKNTFRWTVRRNGCAYSDEVTITNNMPVQAYAGENDSTCSTSYVLHGEEPPFGYGKWTVVAGSGEFENDTSFTTTVSNMAQGVNTYRWTLYNGQCSTSDEVSIVVNKPDDPMAGPDKNICSDSTFLQGNEPSTGQTGYWEVVEGSANFKDKNDPKTKVSGLNYGRNVLRWNIKYKNCILFDEVTIYNNSPTKSFAGDDFHVCGSEANLNALEPTIGTGEWSLVSGTATFEDKNSPNTLVTDLSFGPNTLRWKTLHNGCTSIDDVIVYNDKATAYAGEDQTTYQPSVYLVGNTPTRGEGKWIILGGNGTFENPDSAQTKVKDLAPGVNTFRWTITNNSCVVYDEVSVTYYKMPDVEFAVDKDNGCPPLTVQFLNKSLNANSEFTWDFGDNNISTHENPTHTFYESGEYNVQLSTIGPDGSKVTDDTLITVHELPEAEFDVAPKKLYIPEQHLQCYNMSIGAERFLWNFGDDLTSTLENPMHVYQDTGRFTIELHVWSQHNCYDSTSKKDLVEVIQSGQIKFPSGFTPNPSGPIGGHYNQNSKSNDIFHPIVKGVQEYHLEIFNRWGVMVFESNDVSVGWDGYYQGRMAQEGVYIYKVTGRYNNGRTIEQVGDFILIRK